MRDYTYSVHFHDKIVPYPPALLRLYPHTKALPFTDIDTERYNVSRQYFPFSANGFQEERNPLDSFCAFWRIKGSNADSALMDVRELFA